MVFVAVHIGAGYHAVAKRDKYLNICSTACKVAMKLLKQNGSSLDAVVEAIKNLENEVLTNAGFGSNLNLNGEVECDASLMDGHDLLFGSVGALRSIKNPIQVARLVLEKQRLPMPLGLIAPNFLAGDGATKFAISHNCQQSDLTSDKSLATYNKYKRKLDECNAKNEVADDDDSIKHKRYDTVGAVAIDQFGRVASGVSSGGLILKSEGRVGQASIIGAGCWAEDTVAVCTSGIGEYLIRTGLAKQCAQQLLADSSLQALTAMFNQHYFESPLMRKISREDHLAGILALNHTTDSKSIELVWAHSTATMCIGFMTGHSKTATSFISEMSATSKPGTTLLAESRVFKYK